MDEMARRVLKVFVEMGRESLDLHILFEAGGNDPASRLVIHTREAGAVKILFRPNGCEIITANQHSFNLADLPEMIIPPPAPPMADESER